MIQEISSHASEQVRAVPKFVVARSLFSLVTKFLLLLSMSSTDSASGSQDPTSFLRSATFTRDGPAVSVENAVTANDLLLGAYDPAKLHPLAQLGDQLDYLVLDDDKTSELPGAGTAIPSRGWSDDLCYGTGTMYLSGRFSSLSVP
jgi:hypothetical protein